MDQFEKFENQLLSSYESTLAEESRKICKEFENLFKDDQEFNNIKNTNYAKNILLLGKDVFDIKKVESYLIYCLKKDFVNKDLLNKCKQLKYDISNFSSIKLNLNSISETRTNQKKSLKNENFDIINNIKIICFSQSDGKIYSEYLEFLFYKMLLFLK